ncbi:MAG: NAD(P)H-dependent oxidoreductase [Hydrogenimonas sp.]|jgi:nitroreductase|nr:MAG: NAD(P)H-dependent oxidoreductase [Hydrogenimonas sp.]
MGNKELFLKAMNDRYACKAFDPDRKIPKEDLEYILECGRLSPSSFGVEQWKFLVVQNQEMKDEIQKVSWNQKQVGTCSDLVIILARKDVRSTDPYVQKQLKRYGLPEDKYQKFLKLYADWVDGRDDEILELWSEKQAYIAAANMMTGAAFIGIDSCPIEGFDCEAVDKILGIDTTTFQTALILPFGYRADTPKEKKRLPLDEVVEYIV